MATGERSVGSVHQARDDHADDDGMIPSFGSLLWHHLASMEDNRAVYVAGLPADIKERELNLLFKDQPGFLGVALRVTATGRPMAFANFTSQETAQAVITALNDMVLDPSTGEGLRLELAKAPSRTLSKRPRDGDVYVPPPKMAQSVRRTALPPPVYRIPPPSSAPHAATSSTLYITRIGPNYTTEDMMGLFSAFPGFDRLKVDHEGAGIACCFARFHTPMAAQSALQYLQQSTLPNGEPLRCEFARSDLGSRNSSRSLQVPVVPQPYSQSHSKAPTGHASKTLYVTGMGEAITTPDMTGMCQAFPGFVRLKVDHEGQPNACCFILFQSPANAHYALQHLSGLEVVGGPGGQPVTLRCDFARSDLGSKTAAGSMSAQTLHYDLNPHFFQPMIQQVYASGTVSPGRAPMTNSPISTLYLSGIGSDASAQELTVFCQMFPGFDRLNLNNEGTSKACAFVRFIDHNYALASFAQLQQIPFQGRPLTVEFAKQDLGSRGPR